MQIIGRPFEEELVLAVAEALERSRGPWQAPPLPYADSRPDVRSLISVRVIPAVASIPDSERALRPEHRPVDLSQPRHFALALPFSILLRFFTASQLP